MRSRGPESRPRGHAPPVGGGHEGERAVNARARNILDTIALNEVVLRCQLEARFGDVSNEIFWLRTHGLVHGHELIGKLCYYQLTIKGCVHLGLPASQAR